MKVLFGCEESGVCREEFKARGHDAWSCDLLPSRIPGQHLKGDIFRAIDQSDFSLIVLFPPCTHMTVSGNRWYSGTTERAEAIKWTIELLRFASSRCPMVALENPIGVLSSAWRKPDQIIQPWQHGHGETKATCFWLHGLPLLQPTHIVDGREQRIWKMAPSATRQRDRSATYPGIAKAMLQWTKSPSAVTG